MKSRVGRAERAPPCVSRGSWWGSPTKLRPRCPSTHPTFSGQAASAIIRYCTQPIFRLPPSAFRHYNRRSF